MPDIMIRCPKLRTVVPTGLTTETVKFESIPNIAIPFRCPACQKRTNGGRGMLGSINVVPANGFSLLCERGANGFYAGRL